MTTAAEYRQYAEECVASAREAQSEVVRSEYLDLAALWLRAASHLERTLFSSHSSLNSRDFKGSGQ
jgi:hypothetical protein